MERKLMIIKTLNEAEIAFEDISSQLRHFVKLCCLGGEANNPLYTTGLSFSVLPQTAWTMTEQEDSLGQILNTTDSFSSSEESLASLSSSIHSLLDQLGSPGTFLLTILWLCDSPPPLFPPALYGSLQRAVSWHSAAISVITSTHTASHTPPWLAQLRAEVLPLSYLCSCHGLQEFLSPHCVWRGSLAFYQESDLSPLTLPGFELHLDTDILSSTMSHLGIQGQGVSLCSPATTRFFSPHLEVVTSVSLSSVLSSPHILTSQKVLLKTTILAEDDCSNQFMTSAFRDTPDLAMVLKLKFSVDEPKIDTSLMKTENWKNSVINCNFSPTPPCTSMGEEVSSINILIYDDPDADGDCSRSTRQKAGVLLRSVQELGEMTCLRQVVRKEEVDMDTVREIVEGKIFHVDDSKHTQLKQFVRSVQAEVLRMLHSDDDEFLKNNDVEDVLIAVQEKLMRNIGISMYTTVSDKNFADMEENMAEIKDKAIQDVAIPDDVLLEAKEIVKCFDKEGGVGDAVALSVDNRKKVRRSLEEQFLKH